MTATTASATTPPSSFPPDLALSSLPPPPADAPIDVPPSDKRLYRALTLDNGMQVLLIHDPDMASEAKEGGGEGKGEGGDDDGGSESDGGSGSDSASRGSSLADGAITESESDSEDEVGRKKKARRKEEERDGDESDEGDEGGGGGPSKVKKAAAAVAVGVGSLCDPSHMQGLAHYLEHMLFMGSEKYPDENDYDAYLARHGGMSNAYTELESTVYYFDAKPGALPGALSRFAQFFVAPLCKAGALEREVLAIENEFAGVKQSDSCRLAQMRCSTSRAVVVEGEGGDGRRTVPHPFSRFFWGNRLSLYDAPRSVGTDVRAEVVRFQRENYCAERMSLVVLGGHSLEEMEAMARGEFGAVASGRAAGSAVVGDPGKRPTFEGAGAPYYPLPSPDGSHSVRLHVLPAVKAGHVLHVAFCLPPALSERYRAKAEEYVSHLVGHEGAGSLLSCLKRKGWASALCAGVGDGGTDRSSAAFVFEVAVTLTEAGLRGEGGGRGDGVAPADGESDGNPLSAGRECGLAVARVVFRYLSLLRGVGPQKWVQDEVAAVSAARFAFSGEEEASDEFASRLAESLHRQPPQHALSAPYLHDDWDPRLVRAVLDEMRPSRARIDLRSSSFAKKNGKEGEAETERADADGGERGKPSPLELWASRIPGARTEHEPWFDFDYGVAPLPRELVEAWEREGEEVERRARETKDKGGDDAVVVDEGEGLSLPPRNAYIATDFTLRCDDGGAAGPSPGAAEALPPVVVPSFAREGGAGGETAVEVAPLCRPPSLLVDEPGLRVWHKLDASFRVPKASLHARLTPAEPAAVACSPSSPVYSGAGGPAALHLCSRLLDDALCEEAYLADVAGLSVDAWPEGAAGLEVRVEGFSHRLPELSRAAFGALGTMCLGSGGGGGGDDAGGGGGDDAGDGGRPTFDFSSAFGRAREALSREYRNSHVRPERHATHLRLSCLKRLWSPLDVAGALDEMTPEGLGRAAPSLLAGLDVGGGGGGEGDGMRRGNHLEVLLQGNVTAEDAVALAREARAALPPFDPANGAGASPPLLLDAPSRPEERVALLPRSTCHALVAPALNPDEPNTVVEAYFQLGPDTPRNRAVLDLAAHAAAEPAYNRLRTREQLGYSVHAGARCTHGVLGYCVVVVSSGGSHSPEYVDGRIDAWMAEFGRRLGGGGPTTDGATPTEPRPPTSKKSRKSSSSASTPTTPSASDLAEDAPPITDEELAQHAAALRALKSQADRSLSDEAERHWERAAGGARSYDFLCREEELRELEGVTRGDVVGLWRDWLAPGGSERRKLVVYVCGGAFRDKAAAFQQRGRESDGGDGGVVFVRDAEELRSSLPQAPSRVSEGEARARAWGALNAANEAAAMDTQ